MIGNSGKDWLSMQIDMLAKGLATIDILHNCNFSSQSAAKAFAQGAFFAKMLDSLTAAPVASQKF